MSSNRRTSASSTNGSARKGKSSCGSILCPGIGWQPGQRHVAVALAVIIASILYNGRELVQLAHMAVPEKGNLHAVPFYVLG